MKKRTMCFYFRLIACIVMTISDTIGLKRVLIYGHNSIYAGSCKVKIRSKKAELLGEQPK